MAEKEASQRSVDEACKIFVTNIEGNQPEETVQSELRRLFEKYGKVHKLNVKKNKNGLYYFGFIEFEIPEDAAQAIKELDQIELFGKRMRVRQDKPSQGCFYCKKTGHFARQCPQNKDRQQGGRPPRNNYPPMYDPYQVRQRPPYEPPSRDDRGYERDYQRGRYYRDDRERHGRVDDRHEHRYERRYEGRYGDYGRGGHGRYREDYGHERRHYRSRSPSERRRRHSRSDSEGRGRRYRDQRDRDGRGHREYYPDYRREERRGGNYRTKHSRSPSSSYSSR